MRDRLVIKIFGIYLLFSGLAAIALGIRLLGSGVHLGFYLNKVCSLNSPFQVPDTNSTENAACPNLVSKIVEVSSISNEVAIALGIYGLLSIVSLVWLWVWLPDVSAQNT